MLFKSIYVCYIKYKIVCATYTNTFEHSTTDLFGLNLWVESRREWFIAFCMNDLLCPQLSEVLQYWGHVWWNIVKSSAGKPAIKDLKKPITMVINQDGFRNRPNQLVLGKYPKSQRSGWEELILHLILAKRPRRYEHKYTQHKILDKWRTSIHFDENYNTVFAHH